MNILAAAIPIAASNPVLGIIATAGLIGLTAACASGKKNKPSTAESSIQSAASIVKKTKQTVREVNNRVETAQKTESKQRRAVQSEVKKAKQNSKETTSCHRALRAASSHIEAQTGMTHDQLRAMERLQQDLASTQRSLLDTQRQLREREQDMSRLTASLSETSIKLDEAVKKNTQTSSEIIRRALSTQKTHDETREPLLQSKDSEIKQLRNEVLGLRKTLRQINERLINAQSTDTVAPALRMGSANSSFLPPPKSKEAPNQTTAVTRPGAHG